MQPGTHVGSRSFAQRSWASAAIGAVLLAISGCSTAERADVARLGRQADGSFRVSSGQRIEGDALAFRGRASDIAIHPTADMVAVLSQTEVFLASPNGPLARSHCALGNTAGGDSVNAAFHGITWIEDSEGANWTPDGLRFIVSTDQGYVQQVLWEDYNCALKEKIALAEPGDKRAVIPGGMCTSADGRTLFVAAAGLNEIVEVDLVKRARVRSFPVQALPYEVKLAADGRTLVVSNWGGRQATSGERSARSLELNLPVDARGVMTSGTVSLIDRASGATRHIDVGVHPSALVLSETSPQMAYVTNAASDSVSEIDIDRGVVTRTIPIRFGAVRVFGAMPNALALRGNTLYVCAGGDNAIAEVDIPTGTVRGFRHAGYFPSAIELSHDGTRAFVLNSKGNGSVENTLRGNPGSPHDFQGSITVVDLTRDLKAETELVAKDNHWERMNQPAPDHPVYRGATRHVVYIIKENQTYDSIFGDLPVGNGDPSLCIMGEKVMPNHRKLAREFTLFDNAYVSGTNSADGHAWSTQSIANDYLEHNYVSYRTYPDDGDDPMGISAGGCLWDAAAAKNKSIRVYGEFCDDALAEYQPRKPKDWFEAWEDYQAGTHRFSFIAHTRVAGLAPYICPDVHYWPLLQSDQSRADVFIREFEEYCRTDTLPDLLVLCLPSDHGEGLNPEYPTMRSMQADNDLAFGRVVEAITHSSKWAETIIFCIEDDGQASPDHVDGHRVPYYVISPYSKRGQVDSTQYTTASMLRSIEMILGLDPMTRFDALAAPITTCFQREPDLTPYVHTPNNVPLGERQTPRTASAADRHWQSISDSLNFDRIDGADPYWYSRLQWFVHTDGTKPFPRTPGQPTQPRPAGDGDDDDDGDADRPRARG